MTASATFGFGSNLGEKATAGVLEAHAALTRALAACVPPALTGAPIGSATASTATGMSWPVRRPALVAALLQCAADTVAATPYGRIGTAVVVPGAAATRGARSGASFAVAPTSRQAVNRSRIVRSLHHLADLVVACLSAGHLHVCVSALHAVSAMLANDAAVAALATADEPLSRYHELRLYTVTSNKMDGVLERFRETVEPVRQKHVIKTVGYWSTPGTTNGGTFAYLMAARAKEELQGLEQEFGSDPEFKKGYAASTQRHGKTVDSITSLPLTVDPTAAFDFSAAAKLRTFDLRIYSVLPGKLGAFRSRWRDHAAPIYERHGLHSVGWWVAEAKDAAGQDQFVALLAGESREAIQKSIATFHADPEWQRIEKETEAGGKLRGGVNVLKLTPTDFSTLK